MLELTANTPPDPLDGLAEMFDRAAIAMIAQVTHGLSPSTLAQACSDWILHLACLPGKQFQLGNKAAHKYMRLGDYAFRSALQADAPLAIEALPQDHRFDDPAWQKAPYNMLAQSFLLTQQWWHAATTGVRGVGRHHEEMVAFAARQLLDVLAPTNFIATNPVLQQRIAETGGRCLVDGLHYLIEDMSRLARGEPPAGTEAFKVGEKVAVTPGKVVYRNDLIELIQYSPTTGEVRPEPVLIVPAWIMKYYILDLSPGNSLIRWLVGQGYTVFAISWHNPTSADRNLDMEAYRRLGPQAALDVISAITGCASIHALGYCLGGTLLAITAAALARAGDTRLASVTLLAAQTEFSEPGELGLFIDESQLDLLENMMWSRGYLDSSQMGGAFQILRSNDLIWSQVLTTYLMGEREAMSDLMAWNADGTRMPYAMHSEYLRRLFLENELAHDKYRVEGHSLSLADISAPIFAVGTERDHVAPWRSVYKIHQLVHGPVTFVLTSGGHNAGIVSEPGHPHRSYHILTHTDGEPSYDPEEWMGRAELHQGSWWEAWGQWLAAHSGAPVPPPPMGSERFPPLASAPGHYVLER
ncbi:MULTISPECIES: alpha/beta hydrolase [unclassified Novosphingobium]|uniref:PHA/PHB synthase family protein n=1 Tax=unclassified Novosphingobium TaxID=2644732 RepID=UPI000D2F5DB5|nr:MULTISPECIES: alpha/beta fold hydrolase [unclassified Novosphingobium]PTR05821.1 polyhydroxyalkanoate synthase [Novosphingobium sp. GV055]PUA94380.1 polyhydroxyalkanoate synthase [Novosphingobium sp. GV061]PUB12686.1 polyhydroxyalkanoate synthase [Novosphingobium sp. GV079]PUB38051.1 polyhydroxyalkanoate synthase [Novosphingobium sp. GV027]